ncbi:MAG: helix-turn-helix transcriptional regulator [Anaerolineaceae bacterium]|nr:helix-turn-helix transcriptional regulator [Anaerolineaceae bacterium]
MATRPRPYRPTSSASPLPAPHPTFAQWYSNPRLQLLTSSESLGWKNLGLLIEQQDANPESINVPYQEDDVFAVFLAGSTRIHSHHVGGTSFDKYVGPQSLQLIPRYSEIKITSDSELTYAVLRLKRQFVTQTAADIQYGDPERTELLPTFYFNDPLLYNLGAELVNETRNANPLSPLYADSLTNTLTLYLLRHYSTGRVVRELSSSRLTPAQLRTVDEYIYAHLNQKIALADLAACLHLSVPHFERMFRATTHRPPYRYVLELRLERAKLLLADSRLTVAEAAQQCGFSSQSHFTMHFTRHVGVSPARYAREARE